MCHTTAPHGISSTTPPWVGQECWESSYDYTSIFASGLPSDEVHNPALGNKNSYNISAGFGSSAMASFFTRETLNWDDRYLLTYTYRYDGSSNFGPENRWAGFHSVAAAWRFSNEKFFEPVRNVIDNGKLRLGWGQTGNANIGGYAWGVARSRMPSLSAAVTVPPTSPTRYQVGDPGTVERGYRPQYAQQPLEPCCRRLHQDFQGHAYVDAAPLLHGYTR